MVSASLVFRLMVAPGAQPELEVLNHRPASLMMLSVASRVILPAVLSLERASIGRGPRWQSARGRLQRARKGAAAHGPSRRPVTPGPALDGRAPAKIGETEREAICRME